MGKPKGSRDSTRLEIIIRMLDLSRVPIKYSHLKAKSGISGQSFGIYLEALIEFGLVEVQSLDGAKYYKASALGYSYLQIDERLRSRGNENVLPLPQLEI